MEWILTTLNWYVYLFFLGILAYPITKRIFGSFFDKGYPFAKTIAILFLSYVVFILGLYKILSFTQANLILIAAVFLIGYLYVVRTKKGYLLPPISINKNFFIFLFEEILFLAALFFLTYVRGQEPSVRGLEKFMDYGFMNSILRSKFFPPLDMWLAGNNPINYYYFGHLTGAVLIKLTDIPSSIGYNLILATIFAQAITMVFSLAGNIIYLFYKSMKHAVLGGIIGSFIVNLAGNLHTIYLFTSGYNADAPVPFWKILTGYNPTKYWYPNATRFIPLTIHEFPSYSYVVADLHGHVFDIPFVLLTLAILFIMFIRRSQTDTQHQKPLPLSHKHQPQSIFHSLTTNYLLLSTIFLGFMTAIHYMTNAFDGPIYILLTGFFLIVIFGFSRNLFLYMGVVVGSFLLFSFPFSSHFSPFVSGIGVNCSPDFLVSIGKFGPFLFEKGNCQPDPIWMLFVLWGFFWVCFALFLLLKYFQQKQTLKPSLLQTAIDDFVFVCFTFGTLLIFIPEFFYIKDIYPAHFRANTMFKLGYQAFMIMGVASSYTFMRILLLRKNVRFILSLVFVFFFALIFIYPFYSFPAYYGNLKKIPQLNGIRWLEAFYPEDKEIVDFLNDNIKHQPVILEAQGDSYTDFERISSYTGLPTVAGWWVHEWLWRGSSDVVGKRIPDIIDLYESRDIQKTRELIDKYDIQFVVISRMERDKYKKLYEEKFTTLGNKIFTSTNGFGALYQIKKR
ncbi:hypothetical protein A2334_00055 [Candidatus Roizmanbacteria bacterium RIFOXYB2_FULL_38_10]|uniref:YYY membrane protein n=1 Tax=Candidatus Roizmanbacteria bacterium RIFOXYD1_FULL_38_12 TaxID=1802093 RepID=A0A1F7L2G9_9BACT|nr:MAG: hypothetical protein A3K47_06080 [Candidatus Roizmanbacteria bacterium RIFOXYA2_FULL_38_14]OGK64308.1 MAG: hypothetical protein A3K27_06080 [Candidatus Roizmanbacteria bacterium RIFOXYA1_FULL_37_12]OGK66154.1 MAG: hypothetical protein A3K38_06080 [Candidatus Roizmanbacteria bacterium RIFOXYB1_FULL_40_23]OGK67827.1 MAG: hypothetical protein A2334_00055 [Candidatus Roizmanbacteria bacterium RIFOXYB2_FULL_38_10]OGK70559.1 MAG: hypothetical protein A3K21_06090 [Candidatus Roizmanbacteria ba